MNANLHIQEKKGILNFVSNFSKIVQKEGWISHYDCDSDSFVVRTPQLSNNVHKKYINDEFAFYLNKKDNVEGVFIEYFTSNFVSHHKDIKSVIKNIRQSHKCETADHPLVEFKKNETKNIAIKLESVILNSLIQSPA